MKIAAALLTAAPLLLLGAGCATPQATAVRTAPHPLTRRSMVHEILSHSVKLVVSDGKEAVKTASGVVIASEATATGSASYVLTNAHAVDTAGIKDPRFSVVVDEGGQELELEAEPLAAGHVPELDLALVRVDGVRLPPAQLADDAELDPGASVMVAAAPYGRSISVSGGLISAVELDPSTHRPQMLKTDAPIGYGASGGGIYSLDTGRLLAIVEGYRTARVDFAVANKSYSFDVPMPGETFAAPTAKVRAFLAQKGYGKLLGSSGALSAAP